jgi:NADPH-dependent curcumin reductase CurA
MAAVRRNGETGREVRLAARPAGEPRESDFLIVSTEVPEPGDGQVLVRNALMSVDPSMRIRMDPGASYLPPFELDAPLDGAAVGEVVASRAAGFAEGDVVAHRLGWREWACADAARFRRIDTAAAPPSVHLGALGAVGWTAYVGMLDIGGLRPGDVVYVSAAAGAVGSLAGQVARVFGNRVVGSAGSPQKVAYLTDELGFDAAFDYREGRIEERLAEAAPDGIDLYFDNVGGRHLEAALNAMRLHGRVAACGAVGSYNAEEPPPGPRNLHLLFGRRITMRGFLILDHADRHADFVRDMSGWLRDGRIRLRETVEEGLERAPAALIGLLRGENVGKMLVRLD